MLDYNIELAKELNLNLEELVLLSAIELFANEKDLDNGNKFEMPYLELIERLPILFNSTTRSNIAKLRKMLNKENIQLFVKREIIQRGRARGASVIFSIDKEMLNKLNVKNIIK